MKILAFCANVLEPLSKLGIDHKGEETELQRKLFNEKSLSKMD